MKQVSNDPKTNAMELVKSVEQGHSKACPEKRMLITMVLLAVTDYCRLLQIEESNDKDLRYRYYEDGRTAKRWMKGDPSERFSFDRICALVDIDPAEVVKACEADYAGVLKRCGNVFA